MLSSADAQLPADVIRRKAADVVARPDYQLDQGLDENSRSLLMTLLSWVLKPFVWLYQAMDGLPMFLRIVIILALTLILCALIAHIVYSIVLAIRGDKRKAILGIQDRNRPVDPEVIEQTAQDAALQQQYLEAIRLLFKAALVRIEQSEDRRLRAGITNREILRRYRKSALADPLARMIDLVDRKWYGAEQCEEADFEACRLQSQSVRELIQGGAHAVRA